MRVPKGSTLSNKYIVDGAEASETAGTQQFIIATGTDNAVLGQASATDTAIPVGAKITKLDVRAVFGNLVSVNDFIYWTIQKKHTAQGNCPPNAAGGNPLRSNIMLSGLFMVGDNQNRVLNVKYNIPKKMQRLKDGDVWVLVYNLGQITTTAKQAVYKVFM